MILDLSLGNRDLWKGCLVTAVITPRGKRKLRLDTKMAEAIPVFSQNLNAFLTGISSGNEVCLTGAVMPWVYIVAGAMFATYGWGISYWDGKNNPIRIS